LGWAFLDVSESSSPLANVPGNPVIDGTPISSVHPYAREGVTTRCAASSQLPIESPPRVVLGGPVVILKRLFDRCADVEILICEIGIEAIDEAPRVRKIHRVIV
jgi:hypothetical protein